MTRKLYGVGTNDADYPVKIQKRNSDGTQKVEWICPYYSRWSNMLKRCYDKSYKISHESYAGCEVCEEWLIFSNFKAWMETQEWVDKHLDKDILLKDNHIYSPDFCVFVDNNINSFLVDRKKCRGNFPIGVYYDKQRDKYVSECNDGKGRKVFLGRFNTPDKAHLAWGKYKHNLALKLADTQNDIRVKLALENRFKEYE